MHDDDLQALLPTLEGFHTWPPDQLAQPRRVPVPGPRPLPSYIGTDSPSDAEQDRAIHAYLRWHNGNARPAKPWRMEAEVHHSLTEVRP